MKLNEIHIIHRDEMEARIEKFMRDYVVKFRRLGATTISPVSAQRVEQLMAEDGTLRSDIKILYLESISVQHKFFWPFAKQNFKHFFVLDITKPGFILDDWSVIPNVPKLNLGGVVIKTFKGIEKRDKIKILELMDGGGYDLKVECGLLSLLKFRGEIEFDSGNHDRLQDALSIVVKEQSKPEPDIIECQSALIDAGFDEWAKL